MSRDVRELLDRLDIHTDDISLYSLALTHPSYNSEMNTKHQDYERLEFMGDSVIGFVSADLMFEYRPNLDQGMMTKLRSYLVRSKSLASFAREIELYEYIRIGHSISNNQLKNSDKILEDVFEALTGAIYLNQGIDKAYHFLKDFLLDGIINTDEYDLVDPKTRLQEEIQSESREAVQYTLVGEEGPSHDRTFYVEVSFNGLVLGKGSGKSKKEAEEEAAKEALSKRSL